MTAEHCLWACPPRLDIASPAHCSLCHPLDPFPHLPLSSTHGILNPPQASL